MNKNLSPSVIGVLKHEGGFVNHPSDPGGATNKGITLNTFRRYIKPNGSISELKSLSTDQAVIIYKRKYWDSVLGDMLPGGIDYAVFDFAVNSGPSRAIKYLQSVLGVSVDGRIGPITLAAALESKPRAIINQICDNRIGFMKRIGRGKLWKVFGKGWARRVANVRATSLHWAA